MTALPENMPKPGTRYVLKQDVDRFPHDIARAGESGVIAFSDEETIALTLDKHHPNFAEWDNALQWQANGSGQTVEEMVAEFHADAEEEAPAPTVGM